VGPGSCRAERCGEQTVLDAPATSKRSGRALSVCVIDRRRFRMNAKLIVCTVAGFAAAATAQDYYNQAAFQAAADRAGLGQLFVEDFEEAGHGYGGVNMAEGLTNAPHSYPYTNGITHPLIIQSNLMGDGGATPQPRGNGLAAWEGGIGLPATDAVVADFF